MSSEHRLYPTCCRCQVWGLIIIALVLGSCQTVVSPTATVPHRDAPFPPTWTPTATSIATPTATLVVVPTPTWDGTPPPPSEAYVPRLRPAQLYQMIQRRDPIMLVDVRYKPAFDQAHIPNAIHIPVETIQDRLAELDGNKTIMLYCASPNQASSLQAAMMLYRWGFSHLAVLDGGLQAWYALGYPVDGQILTPKPQLTPLGTVAPPSSVTPLPTSTTIATARPRPTETPTVEMTPTVGVTPTVRATATPRN